MKKKTLLFALIAFIAASLLFAAGTSEHDKLIGTAIELLTIKKPISREASFEKYNLNGDVVDRKTAKALYKWDKTAKRTVEGDVEVFAILDSIYDGILYTPLTNSDDHIASSMTYVSDSIIDGKDVSIYNCKIKVDKSVLFYETLTAYGEVEIKYEIAIYKDNAEIAYQRANFSLDEVDYKQTAIYKEGLPIEITTEGYSDKIDSYALIHDIENFKIVEILTY